MKNFFKIITCCLMLVLTSSLSAQEPEIDSGCAQKVAGSLVDSTFEPILKKMYFNTEKAYDTGGQTFKTEPIIIKATPKKYDKARLIITQKGTWLKGFLFKSKQDMVDKQSRISACAIDEFKTGSVYLENAKKQERIILIEAEFLGITQMVYDVLDFKELDDNYDWTVEWNK